MSRLAASTSSSRFSLPAVAASDSAVSAALRARAMMSSACSRASARRARYSTSSSSDSLRCRSAASIDSLIAAARLSSASWIFGKATLLNTHIVTRNRTSVQIIRPRPGLTRKLPPSLFSAARGTAAMWPSSSIDLREEEGDQAEDEGVEGDRLGQREAEPADAFQVAFHLRLAGDRLDLLAEDETDADTGADRTETRTDTEGNRFAGAFDAFVGDFRERQGSEIHRELLPF